MLRLASPGDVILVGRGANIVTARLRDVLHVRLAAPIERRIRQVQEFHNLSRAEAETYIQTTDRGRRRYVKRHFSADIDNPPDYHFTLNTGAMTFENAALDLVSQPSNHKHEHEPARHAA